MTRFSFAGTWKGTGQRRPLTGINQKPKGNQTVLFTSAWGATTPVLPNATAVVLQPFPPATPNTDLQGTAGEAATGAVPIPPDGAVLVASGNEAAKLAAEAPAGTQVTARLILPSSWAGVTGALGGGPLLVRNHKAVFKTSENFDSTDLALRDARAAIGQLDDGRVILVAVDGGRPGYSVGMTTYELAQAMARLGAVTAAAVEPGKPVTAAFQGEVLNRPSGKVGEVNVKEALLVQYLGVYAPPPSVAQLGKANAAAGEQLGYAVSRPSTVTAELVAPDGSSRQLDTGQKQAGSYRFASGALDAEGTWHWRISATDDQSRQSTAEQTFQVDFTLSGLKVPSDRARAEGRLHARAAGERRAADRDEGRRRRRDAPPASLDAGAQSLAWDDTTTGGAKAPAGSYVARVIATSSIGASSVSGRVRAASVARSSATSSPVAVDGVALAVRRRRAKAAPSRAGRRHLNAA